MYNVTPGVQHGLHCGEAAAFRQAQCVAVVVEKDQACCTRLRSCRIDHVHHCSADVFAWAVHGSRHLGQHTCCNCLHTKVMHILPQHVLLDTTSWRGTAAVWLHSTMLQPWSTAWLEQTFMRVQDCNAPLWIGVHADLHAGGDKDKVVHPWHGREPVAGPAPQCHAMIATHFLWMQKCIHRGQYARGNWPHQRERCRWRQRTVQ